METLCMHPFFLTVPSCLWIGQVALPRIHLKSVYLGNARAFLLVSWVGAFCHLVPVGDGCWLVGVPPVSGPLSVRPRRSKVCSHGCSDTLDLPTPGFLMTTCFAITLYRTTNSFLALYLHSAFATSAWVAVAVLMRRLWKVDCAADS